jgi:hypothetical protein
MNNTIYTIIILLVIILTIIIIIACIAKFGHIDNITDEEDGINKYKVLTPIKSDGKNMNICPEGCIRGVCKKNKNIKESCKYDFQCQYCQDKSTQMFYVDTNNLYEQEILPIYEEEEKLNPVQKYLLNDEINENNKYINLLNKRIKSINS